MLPGRTAADSASCRSEITPPRSGGFFLLRRPGAHGGQILLCRHHKHQQPSIHPSSIKSIAAASARKKNAGGTHTLRPPAATHVRHRRHVERWPPAHTRAGAGPHLTTIRSRCISMRTTHRRSSVNQRRRREVIRDRHVDRHRRRHLRPAVRAPHAGHARLLMLRSACSCSGQRTKPPRDGRSTQRFAAHTRLHTHPLIVHSRGPRLPWPSASTRRARG